MRSIRRHKHAMGALLVDFKQKDNVNPLEDHLERISTQRKDEVNSNGQMCDSIIRYARPQKARSATGEWKYVVNTGTHTQTIRLEKCSTPNDSCAYLTDNYRSRCIQIYNYHRLLSWDAQRGLHVDIFKVPTCCSCHIDGYREAFPPLPDHYVNFNVDDDGYQSESGSKYHYSTLSDSLKGYDPTEEEEEEFLHFNEYTKRKLKPKLNKSSILSSSQAIDAFLSPPVASYAPTYNFMNRYHTVQKTRNRQPVANRKQITDQIPASNIQLNHVTVLPPRTLHEHRPRLPPLITSSSNSTLNLKHLNAESSKKMINYSYHPIIDFFENQKKDSVDRIGNAVERQSSWKPMIVNRRNLEIKRKI